jgi:Flp pilus assembly protein protease CpaA
MPVELQMMPVVEMALTLWLGAVAVWDLRRATIPNWLTVPVALLAGAWQMYQGRWYVLLIWAVLFLIWWLNIMGGGDTKFLMALFAIFPTYHFTLAFSVMVLAISLPLLVAKYWGRRPADLFWAAAARVAAGRLFPSQEELQREGRQYAWTYAVPAVIYLWLLS